MVALCCAGETYHWHRRSRRRVVRAYSVLADLLSDGSIILGVMSLFGAFVRYMQHRVNPLAVPIGSVIMLFLFGVLLVCLPFTYLLFGSQAPIPGHMSHLSLLFS